MDLGAVQAIRDRILSAVLEKLPAQLNKYLKIIGVGLMFISLYSV